MKHNKIIIFILLLIVFTLGLYIYKENNINENYTCENKIDSNDSRFKLFKEKYPFKKILLVEESDISNDGKNDLLIVYNNGDANEMVAIVKTINSTFITKPIKAPRENLKIKFKNIDNKGSKEVIISGSKNGNVGYAIYRLTGEKLTDLFGEGMDKCC